MKLVLMFVLALTLSACGSKNSGFPVGIIPNKPSAPGDTDPNESDKDKIGPAVGRLQGTAFKPVVAGITRSENSDDNRTYYWVRMSDIATADPCHVVSSDRFVGFYISQAQPVAKYNMAETRGAVTGAIFYHNYNGYNVDWVQEGWAQVLAFDKTAGADIIVEIGTGENSLKGAVHAQFCN